MVVTLFGLETMQTQTLTEGIVKKGIFETKYSLYKTLQVIPIIKSK